MNSIGGDVSTPIVGLSASSIDFPCYPHSYQYHSFWLSVLVCPTTNLRWPPAWDTSTIGEKSNSRSSRRSHPPNTHKQTGPERGEYHVEVKAVTERGSEAARVPSRRRARAGARVQRQAARSESRRLTRPPCHGEILQRRPGIFSGCPGCVLCGRLQRGQAEPATGGGGRGRAASPRGQASAARGQARAELRADGEGGADTARQIMARVGPMARKDSADRLRPGSLIGRAVATKRFFQPQTLGAPPPAPADAGMS